jgi:hypothetical protein
MSWRVWRRNHVQGEGACTDLIRSVVHQGPRAVRFVFGGAHKVVRLDPAMAGSAETM